MARGKGANTFIPQCSVVRRKGKMHKVPVTFNSLKGKAAFY